MPDFNGIILPPETVIGGPSFSPPVSYSGMGEHMCIAQTPLVYTAVPATIANDGGYAIVVSSSAIPNGTYRVHVGPLGTAADPICYSGVSGQGQAVVFLNGVATVYAPILPIGGPYTFYLERLVGAGVPTVVTGPLLTVIPHHFRNRTLSLARLLPLKLDVGLRRIETARYPQ